MKLTIGVIAFLVTLGYFLLTQLATPNWSAWEVVKAIIKLPLPFKWDNVNPADWIVLFDILFFVLTFLVGLFFLAQFTLPVQHRDQMVDAYIRLLHYAFNVHAPFIRVKDGKKLQKDSPGSSSKHSGVILLDTASAGVLRNAVSFTRTIGPGLNFTKRNEYLFDTVGLHRKVWPPPYQPLGPLEREDPFAGQKKDETPDAYLERQRRRMQTSGSTRDGVEIVPNIFVAFELKCTSAPCRQLMKANVRLSGEKTLRTPFGFDEQAVYRAVTGQPILANHDNRLPKEAGEQRHVEWYKLPGFMAADLWREYLKKFRLEMLFEVIQEGAYQNKTPLDVIRILIRERMSSPEVDELDEDGKPTGKRVCSREYELLQQRGIQVLFVPIRNLRLPENLDKQLEEKWFSSWLKQAKADRENIERIRITKVHEGETEGLKSFADWAVRRFDTEVLEQSAPKTQVEIESQIRESLELLLRGTLLHAHSDPGLVQRFTGEEEQLLTVIGWLSHRED